jgi:hypothetical protein
MNSDIYDLLYALPCDGKDYSYACLASDLSIEDIPKNRVQKLKDLMFQDDDFLSVEAAKVLTSWGNDDGFSFLESFVCDKKPITENWLPHRLRSYDDTYNRVLMAFISYWAKTANDYNEVLVRRKILRPVLSIISLSNYMQFEISDFFWLVKDLGFTEYIPALKNHLEVILKKPDFHHWKVADCAHLLMKFDPDFVSKALAVHGKTLADYPDGKK